MFAVDRVAGEIKRVNNIIRLANMSGCVVAEFEVVRKYRLADNAMRSNRAMTEMQERMKDTLHGSSEKTTKSLKKN